MCSAPRVSCDGSACCSTCAAVVGVEVQFRLPDTYPDEVPEITIMTGTGLEAGEMREMERNISQQVCLKMNC